MMARLSLHDFIDFVFDCFGQIAGLAGEIGNLHDLHGVAVSHFKLCGGATTIPSPLDLFLDSQKTE